MKKIRNFKEFNTKKIELKIIEKLKEGVIVKEIESLNEKKKLHPELKRLLDEAEEKGDELLIKEFVPEIQNLLDKFSNSGQSGFSAPFTAGAITDALKKLLNHEPLGDGIHCSEDEWEDCSDVEDKPKGKGMFQNKRLSSVFKDGENGNPYFIDAIVFKNQDGITFTGNRMFLSKNSKKHIGSLQYIKKLPFKPKTFVLDCIDTEERSYLKDPSQLDKVWKVYEKPKNI
jgi:hypothetical protein